MPRPSNTAARREQIVAALQAVMAERGYGGASVAAIARAASLTPGLVHYHFGSKQEILLALVEALVAGVAARVARREAVAETSWDRLVAFLDGYVALGDDADPRAVACWVALGSEALRQPAVREVVQATVATWLAAARERVVAALEAEGRQTSGAEAIAAGLVAGIEGAFRLAATLDGVLPEGFAAPALRQLARAAIDAAPAAEGGSR